MGSLEPVPLSPDTLMHPADSDSRSVPFVFICAMWHAAQWH